jgi:DNA/RNA endonuclease YhcR with UshA esterase domain
MIGAFAAATPAAAHHAFSAEFDINAQVELTGTVTEMKWSNPHAWIYIDVVDGDGNVVNWALETPRAANILIRNGWRPEDLPVGRVITVEGWQARNGSPTANITSIVLDDGRSLFAGSGPEDR